MIHSEIELHGISENILKLPLMGRCNKSDQIKRDGWKIHKSTVWWMQVEHMWREQLDPEVTNNLFAKKFGDVEVVVK